MLSKAIVLDERFNVDDVITEFEDDSYTVYFHGPQELLSLVFNDLKKCDVGIELRVTVPKADWECISEGKSLNVDSYPELYISRVVELDDGSLLDEDFNTFDVEDSADVYTKLVSKAVEYYENKK